MVLKPGNTLDSADDNFKKKQKQKLCLGSNHMRASGVRTKHWYFLSAHSAAQPG